MLLLSKSYLLLCSDASLLALDELVEDDEFLVRFAVVVVAVIVVVVEEAVDVVDRTVVELSTSECVPRDLDLGMSSDFPNFSYFPGSDIFFDGRSSLKESK